MAGDAHGVEASLAGAIDFLVHCHIVWSKQNLHRVFNIQLHGNMFWFFVGFVQLLYQFTYLLIVGVFL